MWGGMQVPPRTSATASTSSATKDFPATEVIHTLRPAHARALSGHVLTSLCLLASQVRSMRRYSHPDQAQERRSPRSGSSLPAS